MKNLGICPVCKQGSMMEATSGYACNHFKSVDDKCGFTIYSQYFGKDISEEMAKSLIEKQETKVFNDFVSQSKGTKFSAKLKIIDGHIKPVFEQNFLEVQCPDCTGKVSFSERAVFCENNKDAKCDFIFSRNIAGHQLSESELEKIVKGAKDELLTLGTDYIDDFQSNKGDEFGAKVWLKKEEDQEGMRFWNTKFNFFLDHCPKCKRGNVVRHVKAYGCSNWNNEAVKCDFTVWRNMNGHEISVNELLGLIKNGETKVFNDLKKKGGEVFSGKFMLNGEYKVLVK